MRPLALVALLVALGALVGLLLLPDGSEDPAALGAPAIQADEREDERGPASLPDAAKVAEPEAPVTDAGAPAPHRERQDAAPAVTGPPRLVGIVEGLDQAGRPLANLAGDLVLQYGTEPRRIAFADGRFEVPAGHFAGEGHLFVERIESAGPLELQLVDGTDHLPLDLDETVTVEVRELSDLLLDVIDAASGARVPEVTFFADSPPGFDALDVPAEESLYRTWPTRPPVDMETMPEELLDVPRLLVGARGYAWQRVLVDRTQSGRPVIALVPGADVVVELSLGLLPEAADEAEADLARALDGLAYGASDPVGVLVTLTRLDGEQAGRGMRTELGPRYGRAWPLTGLPLGRYAMRAADLATRAPLAQREVELVGGRNPTIVLEPAEDPVDLAAVLEVELHGPWDRDDLRLLDDALGTLPAEPVWTELPDGGLIARFEGLAPGLLHVALSDPGLWQQVEVEAGGITRRVFELPAMVPVTIEVVDAASGLALDVQQLDWALLMGEPSEGLVAQGSSSASTRTGHFELTLPTGTVRLQVSLPDRSEQPEVGLLDDQVEVSAAGQHIRVRADRTHRFTLVLTVDGISLPVSQLSEVFPHISFEGPGSMIEVRLEEETLDVLAVGAGTWQVVLADCDGYQAASTDPFELGGEGKPRAELELVRKQP